MLGWRPKPGIQVRSTQPGSYDVTVTTNADGLRGRRTIGRERTPGVTRIAVFGCSQTFGSGVEDDETFSARLAVSLRGVEVLNFGVHGYGTDQMLLRWEREGVAYAPDVVVLAFAYYHLDRNITGFRFYAKPHFILGLDGPLRLTACRSPIPTCSRATAFPAPPWPLADRSELLRWLWSRELRRRTDATLPGRGPGMGGDARADHALREDGARARRPHGAAQHRRGRAVAVGAARAAGPQPGRHVGGRRSGARARRAGRACGCGCPATRTGTRRAMP